MTIPRQTLEVDVHRDRTGYWAQVRDLDGCIATGATLTELFEALREAVVVYLSDDEPEPQLVRVIGLRLEVKPDLRPPPADATPYRQGQRARRSHPDET